MNARTILAGLLTGSLLALGGCAAGDKAVMTSFAPETSGTWRFTARAADLQYPPDSASAEETRLDWLREDVINNRACPPNGAFKVERRTVIHKATSYIGVKTYDVIYDVVCEA